VNGLTVSIETKEVEDMLKELLKKVQRPKKLMFNIQRYVGAITTKMFHGRRPDSSAVRGVIWPKLLESTVQAKKAKIKRGKAIATRPMVETGEGRDSLKILESKENGFVYGTKIKTKKGFAYMAFHNHGRFPFLFLKKEDFIVIQRMTIDFLNEKLSTFKSYIK